MILFFSFIFFFSSKSKLWAELKKVLFQILRHGEEQANQDFGHVVSLN